MAVIVVIATTLIMLSVILHEIAHGWVALKFGDDTKKAVGGYL